MEVLLRRILVLLAVCTFPQTGIATEPTQATSTSAQQAQDYPRQPQTPRSNPAGVGAGTATLQHSSSTSARAAVHDDLSTSIARAKRLAKLLELAELRLTGSDNSSINIRWAIKALVHIAQGLEQHVNSRCRVRQKQQQQQGVCQQQQQGICQQQQQQQGVCQQQQQQQHWQELDHHQQQGSQEEEQGKQQQEQQQEQLVEKPQTLQQSMTSVGRSPVGTAPPDQSSLSIASRVVGGNPLDGVSSSPAEGGGPVTAGSKYSTEQAGAISSSSSINSHHAASSSPDPLTAQPLAGETPAADVKLADEGTNNVPDVTLTGMRAFRSRRGQQRSAAAASTLRHAGHAKSSKKLTTAAAAEAAAWQPLGRAGFILAALSSSGLLTEHLPAPAASSHAFTGSSSSGGGSGGSGGAGTGPGGSSSASGEQRSAAQAARPAVEPAPSAGAVALQELAWLHTAAVAGHVDAQLALADRYLLGRGGLTASCDQGLAWLRRAAASVLRKAAESGPQWDALPPFLRLRDMWMDAGYPQSYAAWDDEQTMWELQAAAALHPDGYTLRRLGYRKLLGRGAAVDLEGAYNYFMEAADARDGYALYNLGYMYWKGLYVSRDPAKARQYFKQAFERGVAAGANGLGLLHLTATLGGPASKAAAAAASTTGSTTGSAAVNDGSNSRGRHSAGGASLGSPAGRSSRSVRAATAWFLKGANLSDPEATLNLGYMHLQGIGFAQDARVAKKYLEKAEQLGNWRAAYLLAQLYLHEPGEGGLGYNCEAAEGFLWQFLTPHVAWMQQAQAAMEDYTTWGTMISHAAPEASSSSSRPHIQAEVTIPEGSGTAGSASSSGSGSGSSEDGNSSSVGGSSSGSSSSSSSSSSAEGSSADGSSSSTGGGDSGGDGGGDSGSNVQQSSVISGAQGESSSMSSRHLQALLRHLLLAEAGCEVALSNAAWMLTRGEGAGGSRALGLAVNLLYRAALLNHTDSMTQLAEMLLDSQLVLAPQELSAAAAAQAPHVQAAHAGHHAKNVQTASLPEISSRSSKSSSRSNRAGKAANVADVPLLLGDVLQHPIAAGSAESAAQVLHGSVQPLHVLLLTFPDALLPPVGGTTSATGKFRSSSSSLELAVLADMEPTQQSSSSSSSSSKGAADQSGAAPESELRAEDDTASSTDDERAGSSNEHQQQHQQQQPLSSGAEVVLLRGRHAAVSWLRAAARLGDAEAAAELAWILQRGVVLKRDPEQAQQAIRRAAKLAQKHTVLKPAVRAMAAALQLEQLSRRILGSRVTSAVIALLVWARELVSNAQTKPAYVLTLPDGLMMPAAAGAGGQAGEETVAEEELMDWLHEPITGQGASHSPAAAAAGLRTTLPAGSEAGRSGTQTNEASSAPAALTASSSSSSMSGAQQQQQQGFSSHTAPRLRGLWRVLGGDKVDPDNVLLTVMLGALAGVLFLRRRQQVLLAAAAAARRGQHPVTRAAPQAAAIAASAGGVEALQQQQQRQQQQPAVVAGAGQMPSATVAPSADSRAAPAEGSSVPHNAAAASGDMRAPEPEPGPLGTHLRQQSHAMSGISQHQQDQQLPPLEGPEAAGISQQWQQQQQQQQQQRPPD